MSGHPIAVVGLVLLVLGLLLYLGSIVAAVLRVGRQYHRAIQGHTGLHVSAALAAAAARWYFLVVVAVGAALVAIGR